VCLSIITQELSENQKATVKDLLEAFILKTDLLIP